ncbi:MAG: NTP transferase domain-containing protein [Candidatus Eisenbacteria bacterium]|nr:NTP transferase domain-containing protein [Candidatus Latescibacterota bacterium]MBD3301498.1 NTP transferase domain-containing protein [Candidatus Eisenbacteria bacterium]
MRNHDPRERRRRDRETDGCCAAGSRRLRRPGGRLHDPRPQGRKRAAGEPAGRGAAVVRPLGPRADQRRRLGDPRRRRDRLRGHDAGGSAGHRHQHLHRLDHGLLEDGHRHEIGPVAGGRTRSAADVEGFVLAGGESSRFGADKALALFEGRPLLAVAVAALEAVGLEATVVTPRPEPYRGIARRFLTSERPGLGPVEGLRVILRACGAPRALVLAVDMPGVGPDTIRPLLEERDEPGSVVCYAAPDGRPQPFPAIYPRILRDRVEAASPGLSVRDLLRRIAVVRPAGPGVPPDRSLRAALRNVNRPKDLEQREDGGERR